MGGVHTLARAFTTAIIIMLPQTKSDSPQELAQRMMHYTEVHANSGDAVHHDPEQMTALCASLQAEGLEVSRAAGPGSIENPLSVLQLYDNVLATSPSTYKEYCLHYRYAFLPQSC
ncbi:hypothetical protein CPB83DRAFT_862982 [Crepidotus variabilis]|uniref:Uncharacterized protein n=1 Tax=Crepidotus variabilis TaxID=179855 RepID=A0A9P6E6H2_9AGAR|nr:hypothetical protein CPB83DRAFT_862982 [Crepidotus variabilis]